MGERSWSSGRVLRAVRVVLAAQITVAAIEEPQHGRDVRWPVDAMADALGHRIGWFRIAVLDEFIALRIREAQLCHAMLAIEDAEFQMLVAHDRRALRASLYMDAGPGSELTGDVID